MGSDRTRPATVMGDAPATRVTEIVHDGPSGLGPTRITETIQEKGPGSRFHAGSRRPTEPMDDLADPGGGTGDPIGVHRPATVVQEDVLGGGSGGEFDFLTSYQTR